MNYETTESTNFETTEKENEEHTKLLPGKRKKYKNKGEQVQCSIMAEQKARSRLAIHFKKLAIKIEKEHTNVELDTLFLFRPRVKKDVPSQGTRYYTAFGYGEVFDNFLAGVPLSDGPPPMRAQRTQQLPTIKSSQKKGKVELLTPEKDIFMFGVGSGRTMAEEQKRRMENLEVSLTSPQIRYDH